MSGPVAISPCKEYDREKLLTAVDKMFEQLGGIERFFGPEDTVLLKPNLLMPKKPESATTTHPAVMAALSRAIVRTGASVFIAESPGGPFNRSLLKLVYSATGITRMAEEEGIECNWDTGAVQVRNRESAKILKTLTVMRACGRATKIVSVAKLKTHGITHLTASVKNLFGIVPGVLKAEYHYKMSKIEDFSEALLDICLYAQPVFSLIDAVVAMEGAGPSGGTPQNLGVLLGSGNPYHLDMAAASLVKVPPKNVATVARSIERGLCPADVGRIELRGGPLERYSPKSFSVPPTRSVNLLSTRAPAFLRGWADVLLRPKPVFLHDRCVACGICARDCPAGVICMDSGKPEVDLSGCIRCFCCQELCPHTAVKIKRPFLMKIAAKL